MSAEGQPLTGSAPTVEVACANSGCPRHGQGQWVRLQLAAQQFAVMPVLICTRCGQAAMVVRPWQPRLQVLASNTDPVSDSPQPAPRRRGRPPKRGA